MRFLLLSLLALLSLPAHAGLRVVATVPDLAAITREVLRDRGTVSALSLPTQDPHFVDARPSLALDLARADALILVGLELEVGWLPNLLVGARNPRIQVGGAGYVDCSTFVHLQDVPSGKVDRSMGDVHPGGNPHYLYDPRAADAVAFGIAARLTALDPAGGQIYTNNAADFVKRLDAARVSWEALLAPLRGKPVVTYHASWAYFTDWLGLVVPIHVEPKPGIPPSPAHVAQVLTTMQEKKIGLILQEIYYPETTPALLQARTGAKLLRIPGGADFAAGQTYIERMDQIVHRLAELGAG